MWRLNNTFLNNQQVTEGIKKEIKDLTEINEKEIKGTIVKINKTKSWFFEKIKWTNLWPDSPRKKREKNQINKIRSKKERLQQTIKMFL